MNGSYHLAPFHNCKVLYILNNFKHKYEHFKSIRKWVDYSSVSRTETNYIDNTL